MGRLHQIRLKSDSFVSNINLYIADAIRKNEKSLVDMNRGQMLKSKDIFERPLIHKSTGRTTLSRQYSIKTGKSKPNLYLKGDFQREMFLDVNENNQTYFVDSFDDKSKFLTENYGKNIFGVPKKQEQEAKQKNLKTFARIYKLKVYG